MSQPATADFVSAHGPYQTTNGFFSSKAVRPSSPRTDTGCRRRFRYLQTSTSANSANIGIQEKIMSELTTLLTEAFDTASEEGTPAFELLPAGNYVASITEAQVGALKSGKGQAISLTWEIQGGAKRLVFDRVIVQHESADAMKFGRRKLKDICDAVGVKEALTDLTVLRNKPCSIYVKIEHDSAGEYPPKNRVGRVRPIAKPDAAVGNSAKPVKPDYD